MESSDSLLSTSSPSAQSLSLSPSMTIMENVRETPQPQYLKLEDLQSAASPSSTVFDSTQQSPATVIIHSKPAKKRKSWGQELPQPTTNLPPRKRAKTEAEREQRRIERIKRNRAAAHNSRERKRAETENLAVLLARARAELDAYRRLHGPLPADVVLPEVTLNKDPYVCLSTGMNPPSDSCSESPGPMKYSDDASTCMPSPATSLIDSNLSIKEEPMETVSPMAMFEELDSKPSPLPTLDVTQHSAVMLCDLPCPSSLGSVRTTPLLPMSTSTTSSTQSLISQASQAWWARLFLALIHLHIQSAYRTILLAIWTISPSRMQAMISRAAASLPSQTRTLSTPQHSLATTTATLSSSMISSTQTPSQLLRSTQLLAQLNAATSRVPAARRSVERRSSTTTRDQRAEATDVVVTESTSSQRAAEDPVSNVSQRNGVTEER